jgi:hypothetical protein
MGKPDLNAAQLFTGLTISQARSLAEPVSITAKIIPIERVDSQVLRAKRVPSPITGIGKPTLTVSL